MDLLPTEKVAILNKAESLFLSPHLVEFVSHSANPNQMNIEYRGVKSMRLYLNVLDKTTCYSLISMPYVDGRKSFYTIRPEFDALLGMTEKWLALVKQEVDAEKRYSELLNPDNYIDFDELSGTEEIFTKEEFESLKKKVQLLHLRIDALQIDITQKEELKQEVDKSVRKAEEKGYTKQDFFKHLIGAFITRITNWTLSQENLRSIWQVMNDFFQGKLELPS